MPHLAWTCAESRAFDQHLQRDLQISACLLMENAAAALSTLVKELCAQHNNPKVLFAIGPGNNGADALVALRQLTGTSISPKVYFPFEEPQSGTLLHQAMEVTRALKLKTIPTEDAVPKHFQNYDLIVDGLFGVGLSRPLSPTIQASLQPLIDSGVPSLAVDCPSGLNADTGHPSPICLPAKWTLSFIGPKQGFFTEEGRNHVGEIHTANIGISEEYAEAWLRERRG